MSPMLAATASTVLVSILCAGSARGQATSPQQDLQQTLSELQKSPRDIALRERIITIARGMKMAPSIPEEARRHYVMAKTLFEGAAKPEDLDDSIEEFEGALLIAPWWAEANRDLGLALENAGRFDEAIDFIRLYIATGPGEDRVRAAQDEIYKIEGRKRLAAREDRNVQAAREEEARKAAEEARMKSERARLESPEGRWCFFFWNKCMPETSGTMEIRSKGGQWTVTFPSSPRMYTYDIRQNGRRIVFTRMMRGADPELNTDYLDLTLSSDGKELNGTIREVDISGNRPHWTTDQIKWVRQ